MSTNSSTNRRVLSETRSSPIASVSCLHSDLTPLERAESLKAFGALTRMGNLDAVAGCCGASVLGGVNP